MEDRTVPSFLAPVSYAGGDVFGSLAVAAADFNRDGTPDLVMPDSSNGTADVLLGNRDGTFQPAHAAAVLGTPSAVAVGDFNGDGKPDIVTTDDYNGLVNVLLGHGDGTFELAAYFRLPATGSPENQTLYSVAVGDLNGDGKPDLVITGSASQNYVNVLLGRGDGTFSPPNTVQVSTSYDGYPVALGDFNGDGRLDVATTAADGVLVLPGNGDGSLGTARTFDTNGSPGSVVVGDFNADGKLDLAATAGTVTGGPTVSVLLGNGDGTFQPPRSSAIGTGGQWLTAADFNHDGRADLVTANTDGGNVSVLLGKGDGTFQNALNYAAGPNPWAIAAADFNGDGFPDLAVANNNTPGTVSVLLNAADWSAPQPSSLSVSGFPSSTSP